jgi:hypothetical protein
VGGAISEADYLEGLRSAGLEEVEVLDRLTYDPATLAGMILADVDVSLGGSLVPGAGSPAGSGSTACCGSGGEGDPAEGEDLRLLITRAAAHFEGRVASVLVSARRPSAGG